MTSIAVAANIATIVVAIAVVVMATLSAVVFFRTNHILRQLEKAAMRDFGPVADRAKVISGNVEFITRALRNDVDRLNGSVRALTDRLHQASEHMEERIEDFNALMEVVQDEAEGIFLDTASTVRGVREGARVITAPSDQGGRRPVEDDVASDHGDGTLDVDADEAGED